MSKSLPILLYHHVSPGRAITPQVFEDQLRWLKEQKIQALSLEKCADRLTSRSVDEKRCCAITFDDGYLDNWVYAFPLLEKYRMKAAIFVITDRAEEGAERPRSTQGGTVPDTAHHEREPGSFLNWAEMKAMRASGLVEIGSHSCSHKGFRRDAAWNIPRELHDSKQQIERRLGSRCDWLAWPWGDYDAAAVQTARVVGYQGSLTTQVGANCPGDSPYYLKRMDVKHPSLDWFSKRYALFENTPLVTMYGMVYGWDRKVKSQIRRLW